MPASVVPPVAKAFTEVAPADDACEAAAFEDRKSAYAFAPCPLPQANAYMITKIWSTAGLQASTNT